MNTNMNMTVTFSNTTDVFDITNILEKEKIERNLLFYSKTLINI